MLCFDGNRGYGNQSKQSGEMEKLLTTKELAAAVGASESSMRRWTDSGAIQTSRTVGGHRRIPVSEAIRFIRETHSALVRPDILGLGPIDRASGIAAEPDAGAGRLFDALNEGDATSARAIVLGQFLAGASLAAIFDGPLGGAMRRVGELWQHGPSGILVEHRASDIAVQIISELRRLLPPAGESAPVAVGGAPQGDPYLLPSMMAAAVMVEAGYRDVNFGPQTPVHLLAEAAEAQAARIVWLSVSVEGHALGNDVEALAQRLRARDAQLVVGGRHASDVAPRPAANVHVLQTMSELAAFVRGVGSKQV